MAITIQIVILDSKDFIVQYKDFKPNDRDAITAYVWEWMGKPEGSKIQIRKWGQ